MVKDINNQIITTAVGSVNNINQLYDIVSTVKDLKEENIIGFAKFEPFLNHDKKFCNILCKGSWYPIVAISNDPEDLTIQLHNMEKTELSLFESIVPVEEQNSLFDKLKNNNSTVQKYFKEKEKEIIELEKQKDSLFKEVETEEQEYERLNKLRGQKVRRQDVLSKFLKNKLTKEDLFLELKNSKLRDKVMQDINYRLKTIEIAKDIPSTKSYYFKFKGCDSRNEIHLTTLKSEIKEFDFNCDKAFKNKFPNENIKDFLRDKINKLIGNNNRKRSFSS